MKVMLLPLTSLRKEERCQTRVNFSVTWAEQMKEHLEAGGTLPEMVAFLDTAGRYWLADGYHRYAAYKAWNSKSRVAVTVHRGELRDAILYAVSANTQHGLQLTDDDKRKAARILLEDEEWKHWTDRKIAELCGWKTHGPVGDLRRKMKLEAQQAREAEEREESAASSCGSKSQMQETMKVSRTEARKFERDGKQHTMTVHTRETRSAEEQAAAQERENARNRAEWLKDAKKGYETVIRSLANLDIYPEMLERARKDLATLEAYRVVA